MAKDLLHKEDNELKIVDGDFAVGYSDEQHVEDILLAYQGHYKQHPLIGVAIVDYLNGPMSGVERLKLERIVRLQLESDGATEIKVQFDSDGKIEIEAVYE